MPATSICFLTQTPYCPKVYTTLGVKYKKTVTFLLPPTRHTLLSKVQIK